jgi:hypothetical protein
MRRLLLAIMAMVVSSLTSGVFAQTAQAACAVSITSPVNGATVSGTITVRVSDACTAGFTNHFNRLYFDRKTYDIGSSLSLDTTKLPDGIYWAGDITWDPTGLIKYGTAHGITFNIQNGAPTPIPTPAPTSTPTPVPTSTPPAQGCNVSITSPIQNAVVSGTLVVSVSDACVSSIGTSYFNRLYFNGKTYDFGSSLSVDISGLANGTYGWETSRGIRPG